MNHTAELPQRTTESFHRSQEHIFRGVDDMDMKELKQAAMTYLVKAFTSEVDVPAHVVQAAVSIVLTRAD